MLQSTKATVQSSRDTQIVLAGAGHAHVEVLRRFGKRPLPGVRLVLVTREVMTPYSGMLPGAIAGLYAPKETHIDTRPLAAFAGAHLIHDEVVGLDLAGKHVICRDGQAIPFDVLSIDIGAAPSAHDVPGVAEHAIPVKPIDRFLTRLEEARQRIRERRAEARIGVVGGGAGGVELILSLHRRLSKDADDAGFDSKGLRFTLTTATPELLPTFPRRMQRRFAQILTERGIKVITDAPVREVTAQGVRLDDRGPVPLDEIFWTTSAAPAPWLCHTGFALDKKGFIRVRSTLQSVSHPDVFAAGDIAAIDGHDLPKSGVYAVRSGPPLSDNLRAFAEGRPLRKFRPQRQALYILSTGMRYALATRNGFTVEGAWIWRLKDYIDRQFIMKYQALKVPGR